MKTKIGRVRVGQSVTICARVFDAYNPELLLLNRNGAIETIQYSLFKLKKGVFGEKVNPIQGHMNVQVSTDCLLSDVQYSDSWTMDEYGYNFMMTPNIAETPLFQSPGRYRFRITILLTDISANPIVFNQDVFVIP